MAELVNCTSLDIYGTLPSSALTPATTSYAAYFIYSITAEMKGGHRGLSYPDQETTVAVGGHVVARHTVCLCPDEEEARKFVRGGGAVGSGGEEIRWVRRREDRWWEMEMEGSVWLVMMRMRRWW